jgi:hypothetical protein
MFIIIGPKKNVVTTEIMIIIIKYNNEESFSSSGVPTGGVVIILLYKIFYFKEKIFTVPLFYLTLKNHFNYSRKSKKFLVFSSSLDYES